MTPAKEVPDMKQTDLEGKPARRGRIKYRKLFSKRSKEKTDDARPGGLRADSESEGKVIAWLNERGIAFRSSWGNTQGRHKCRCQPVVGGSPLWILF